MKISTYLTNGSFEYTRLKTLHSPNLSKNN